MSTPVVNIFNLTDNNKVVDQNGQEVPVGTIVHCSGVLFKVTNSRIKHLIGKIEGCPQNFCQFASLPQVIALLFNFVHC